MWCDDKRIYRSTRAITNAEPIGRAFEILAETSEYGRASGPAAASTFCFPRSLAVDRDGSIIILESYWIRRLTVHQDRSLSEVTPITNQQQPLGFADGHLCNARFASLTGMALSFHYRAEETLIICSDCDNNRIRGILPVSGMVFTIAGTGEVGYVDGPLLSASFTLASGTGHLNVDGDGNIIVCEFMKIRDIRMGDDGLVTTIQQAPNHGKVNGTTILKDGNILVVERCSGRGRVVILDSPRRKRMSIS